MKRTEQKKQTIDNLKSMNSYCDFFWDNKAGITKFSKGRLNLPTHDEPKKITQKCMSNDPGLSDLQPDLDESFDVSHIEKDKQGFRHVDGDRLSV